MSGRRDVQAAALTVEMRTPLARIELASSQLERDAITPAARQLATGISQAVEELDRLIQRALHILIPSQNHSFQPDVGAALEALRERVAPSLAALGLYWERASANGPVGGDPDLVRRGASVLLRALSRGALRGSRVQVKLLSCDDRTGIQVEWMGQESGVRADGVSLDEVRRFALAHGGHLEWEGHEAGTLWLPHGSAA